MMKIKEEPKELLSETVLPSFSSGLKTDIKREPNTEDTPATVVKAENVEDLQHVSVLEGSSRNVKAENEWWNSPGTSSYNVLQNNMHRTGFSRRPFSHEKRTSLYKLRNKQNGKRSIVDKLLEKFGRKKNEDVDKNVFPLKKFKLEKRDLYKTKLFSELANFSCDCHICIRAVYRKEYRIRHSYDFIMKKIQERRNAENNNPSDLVAQQSNHTKKPLMKCDLCKQSFSRKTDLKHHIDGHTQQVPFHCKKCKRRFSRKLYFPQHNANHPGSRSFECHICKTAHLRKKYPLRHLVTQRKNNVDFKCEICSKVFHQRNAFATHLHGHANKKFAKSTPKKQKLIQDKHLRQVLKTEKKMKEFRCTVCFSGFTYKKGLVKHMRHFSTDKQRCGKCNKVLRGRWELQTHPHT